jgi:hypothetical protein
VENRFETFPDPFNNWVVWDRKKNSVAEVGSQILRFLSEARARELCGVLNRQWPALKQSTNGWPPAKILAESRSGLPVLGGTLRANRQPLAGRLPAL